MLELYELIDKFYHGDNLVKRQKSLQLVNQLFKKWLLNQITTEENYRGVGSVSSMLSSLNNSFFWPRILGSIPSGKSLNDPKCYKYLKPVLNYYKIQKMFIGHTPQNILKEEINSTCDNKLFKIDVGLSKTFNSKLNIQWAEILDDNKVYFKELRNNKVYNIN